ncbi:MAG: VTT domain-containing protein [Gemmatimonadota bacterium]|jgi:membrane-associated protein|nr:VTT domain-containing protein [Gemmatimonadota bacterium]MDQ8169948.1 VTT domain-containing protein [Gemmatimonadota bacterium]MDQ8177672.1 VTT domain-containing protein [Gemmatimonadota bacterium]
MDPLLDLFHHLRDLNGLVTTAGYAGVTAIIFIETGLLFPFLPGDSLLVTAGLVAVTGTLNVWTLGLLCSVAAIVGDQIAYAIGRRSGQALFSRPDSRWFKQEHLRAAQAFYEKHGGKTIILARFMPFARTFAPVVAGAARMQYPMFVLYNVIGGLLWIWSMLLTGYYVVRLIPGLEAHVEKLIIGIIVVSVLPGIIGWWRSRRHAS